MRTKTQIEKSAHEIRTYSLHEAERENRFSGLPKYLKIIGERENSANAAEFSRDSAALGVCMCAPSPFGSAFRNRYLWTHT